jgi:hypothetical protein
LELRELFYKALQSGRRREYPNLNLRMQQDGIAYQMKQSIEGR